MSGQMHAPACRRMHQQTEALFLTEQRLRVKTATPVGGFPAHSGGQYRNWYIAVKFVDDVTGF